MTDAITIKRNKLLKAMDKAFKEIEGDVLDIEGREGKIILAGLLYCIKCDEKGDFLSFRPGKEFFVTYCRKPEDKGEEKRRVATTLIKYLNSLMKHHDIYLDGETIRMFAGEVCSYLAPPSSFRILKGKAITKYYAECHKVSGSCMTGKNAYKTAIYADNPKKISMVVMDDTLRALLWKTDGGKVVMDVVYPKDHWKDKILMNWAKRKGYEVVDEEKDGMSAKVSLKIHQDEGGRIVFPFLDSFSYTDKKTVSPNKMILEKIGEGYAYSNKTIKNVSGQTYHKEQYLDQFPNGLPKTKEKVPQGKVPQGKVPQGKVAVKKAPYGLGQAYIA